MHAIVSLVERKSGYAVLAKVESKTSDQMSTAIIVRLKPIARRVRILTYDNGKEFADHAAIDKVLYQLPTLQIRTQAGSVDRMKI